MKTITSIESNKNFSSEVQAWQLKDMTGETVTIHGSVYKIRKMHREKMRELDRRERELEERERRLEERQRAHEREDRAYRRIGYVVPEDCYGEDCDEYYEGEFHIVRGREY